MMTFLLQMYAKSSSGKLMMKKHTRLFPFVSAEADKLDNQNLPACCHNQNQIRL